MKILKKSNILRKNKTLFFIFAMFLVGLIVFSNRNQQINDNEDIMISPIENLELNPKTSATPLIWDTPIKLTTNSLEDWCPTLCYNSTGALHVAWVQNKEIFHGVIKNGALTEVEQVTSGSPTDYQGQHRIQMEIDSNDKIHIMTVYWSGTWNLFYVNNVGGSWTSPTAMTSSYYHGGNMRLFEDSRGQLIVSWVNYEGRIYVKNSSDSGSTWSSEREFVSAGNKLIGMLEFSNHTFRCFYAYDDGSHLDLYYIDSNDYSMTWGSANLLWSDMSSNVDRATDMFTGPTEATLFFSLTESGGSDYDYKLYKSTDYGMNWEDIGYVANTNGTIYQEQQIKSIYNNKTGYIISLYSNGTDIDSNQELYMSSSEFYIYGCGEMQWKFYTGTTGESHSSPAFADVDNDGEVEVIIGSGVPTHKLFCLSGSDGDEEWSFTAGDYIFSSPAIVDVDSDGQLEVIFGSSDDIVYCLSGNNGSEEWRYTTSTGVQSSPAIGDVDNDGQLEVVFGSEDNNIYCLSGNNGSFEWSRGTSHDIFSSPAIGDLNEDGKMEIYVGCLNGYFYCLEGDTGEINWSYQFIDALPWVRGSPAIGDVDDDGKLEVIIGVNDDKIYCFNATGDKEWEKLLDYDTHSSVTIGDINADNKPEVFVGTTKVYCLYGNNGSEIWNYPTGGFLAYSSPTIGDIDGDKQMEILIGSNDNHFYCLSGNNGSQEWNYTTGGPIASSGTLGDIDGDDRLEVVFGSIDGYVYCLAGNGKPWAQPGPWPTHGMCSLHGANSTDNDDDGLPDLLELSIGLDPNNGDTDGDGEYDGYEINIGTDPTDPLDFIDNDITGPIIGNPSFSSSVQSNETLSVTSVIIDPSNIKNATLYYGYSSPYNTFNVIGTNPSGDNWEFTIPAQGDGNEGSSFKFSIIAYDDDNSQESTTNNNGGLYYGVSVTDDDTAGPSISGISFSSSIVSNETLTVSCTITDYSGILSSTLYYGYSNPYNQNNVGGTNTGGNNWEFVIPAQGDSNEGSTLSFYMQATDNDNSQLTTTENNGGSYYDVDITDDDTTGPSISGISFSGSTPSNESLTVSCTITDWSDVASATLFYGYTGTYDDYNIIGTNPSGDLWEFIIPSQGDGNESNTLRFAIGAVDNDNSPSQGVNNNGGACFPISITDDDTSGPTISGISFTASVVSNETLTVTCTITDWSGVSSATLYYGYSNPYNQYNIGGTNTGGNNWEFIIPAQGDGNETSTLSFYIDAFDNDNSPASTINNNSGSFFDVDITDDDTAGPVINGVTFSSTIPSNETLTVACTLWDYSGVSSATLYYGYSSPYNQYNIGGTNTGGNNWEFIIPAQADGNESSTLSFFIDASDNDNSQASTTDNNGGSFYDIDITDDDTSAPNISAISFSGFVASNETLTVTCTIWDYSGVLNGTLYYGYSNPYNQYNIGGTNTGGNNWEFVIPAQGDSNESNTLRFYIEAIDNDNSQITTTDNNSGVCYGVDITDDDTTGPNISSVSSNPTVPSNTTLTVTSIVSDPSGVLANVTLLYGYIAPFNQYNVLGSNIGGNNWEFIIPAQGVGNETLTLKYYIMATDNDNSQAYTIEDNSSNYYSVIITDVTPPENCSIIINSGELFTYNSTVILNLSADGANEMKFRNELGTWSVWEPYSTLKQWNLSSGFGVKTIYVVFRDNTFNEANAVNSTITLISNEAYFFDTTENIDLISEYGVYLEIEANAIGYIEIQKQPTLFSGIDQPSNDFQALYYYSFEILDENYASNPSIIESVKVRLYFNSDDIGDTKNLRVLKYSDEKWVEVDISINPGQGYIEFTTSSFSVYALGESEPEGSVIIIIIIIIIIGSAVGISGVSFYSVKKRSKTQKQSDLKKKAQQKKEAIAKKTWQEPSKPVEEVGKVTPIVPKEPKVPKVAKKGKKEEELLPVTTKEPTFREKLEMKKTEAELTVEKEKFTCIVHRGTILGNMYVCHECQSIYCDRCAKVLKVKGEKCWSCNADINVTVTESERKALLEKNALDIMHELISEVHILKDVIENKKKYEEKPEIYEYEFTIMTPKELEQIDLLDLSLEEKTELIKDLLSLKIDEREKLLDDILKEE